MPFLFFPLFFFFLFVLLSPFCLIFWFFSSLFSVFYYLFSIFNLFSLFVFPFCSRFFSHRIKLPCICGRILVDRWKFLRYYRITNKNIKIHGITCRIFLINAVMNQCFKVSKNHHKRHW